MRHGLSLSRERWFYPNGTRSKNPAAPAVKREAEEDWGKGALAISGTTRR
jgi:hypothetical protein